MKHRAAKFMAAGFFAVLLVIVILANNHPADPVRQALDVTGETARNIEIDDNFYDKNIQLFDYTDEEIVLYNIARSSSYCENNLCRYNRAADRIEYSFDFAEGIPTSDDDNVYLFEVSTYEEETSDDGTISGREPVATARKSESVTLKAHFEKRFLFSRFIPALLYKGKYIPLSSGLYISNPHTLATNHMEYLKIDSKKGLLLDANTLGSDKLTDLNVKRMVFNIPISYLTGETEDEAYPTIEYEYNGETYYFNGYRVMLYDSLFSYLTEQGYHNTAIVLNDWNEDYPEIMHPKSRRQTGSSMYYALNTEEEEGVRLMEAVALFLAERYSGGEHGMVYDWVIANEINQQRIWNYMATSDLEYYTESFEKSFRTFYNAIKSVYGDARVYFSIDHDWNDNGGNNFSFFNARDLMYAFNECAKKGGNYDWGLSIHPYPQPLTKVRFWQGSFDKTEEARTLTPMNLPTLTDMMEKDEFLNTKGKVRNIAMTEIGFSSKAGEKLQAAAFAYSYYIMDNNSYIDCYLMNRQTDDTESLKSGLALGIYNNDYTPKYIAEVFKYIDTDENQKYLDEMLEIIGAESLEEALEWAE